MKLYLGKMIYPVISLGPGKRLGFFFSGCSIGCPGCMSKYLWEQKDQHEWKKEDLESHIYQMKIKSKRVVISGGEPFEQPIMLEWLLQLLKSQGVNDIWVYSGNYLEKLQPLYSDILSMIDVLIDGPFCQSMPTQLIYRGSANQHLILLSDMAKKKYQKYINFKPKKRPLQIFPLEDELFVVGIPGSGEWNDI